MMPYIFQAVLAALLVLGVTVAVTKFVLEVAHIPVMADEEWETQQAPRHSGLNEKL
jgi:hypothetical protein